MDSIEEDYRFVDLKTEVAYIDQYIELRNIYKDLLLTSPVNREETVKWMREQDIEIAGIANDSVLLGVVILYLSKDGEVTFFARDKNRGIGTMLLSIAEQMGHKRRLDHIWAWVLEENLIARHVFEKCGFIHNGVEVRNRNESLYRGIRYIKKINK